VISSAGRRRSSLPSRRVRRERYTVTGELLTNTIEVTSGIGDTVASAVDDIADAIAQVRAHDPCGIELLCAGSHPFAQWYDQQVTDKTRYHTLIERTQWWGRNMMIWGIHVHVGVEDVTKVLPIIGALATYLPHLQALSASSPFWAGERTGYASNRALVFQQLPTAGLPGCSTTGRSTRLPRRHGAHRRHGGCHRGALGHPPRAPLGHDRGARVRRHVDAHGARRRRRPRPGARRALLPRARRGRTLERLQPWFVRENKWRAARYGLDARVIVDSHGTQRP
jgi:carboxylate-amine ligase